MRKILVFLHRYLGLALVLFLVISSVTGTLIVFAKPIDAWLNPELLRVQPAQHTVSVDTMLATVRAAVPESPVGAVFVPLSPGTAWEFWFQGDSDLRAYVDPHTGKLLGTRHATQSVMGFLVDLHIHLLKGKAGQTVLGWAGLGAILLTLFGLYLWWPKKGRWKAAFAVKWGAAPARLWLDLHKVVGALAAILIMLTAATGALITLHDEVTEPLLTALTGESAELSSPKSLPSSAPDHPIAPMVALALDTYPGARLSRISLPARPDSPVTIRVQVPGDVHQFGRSFLWFDRHQGNLLSASDIRKANAAMRLQNWFYPLHTGYYGGLATRWLQLLVGLALALITFSGTWLWWRNRRSRRLAAERMPNLPEGGL
jgi:uncharacterized iron-regulated membrane protein